MSPRNELTVSSFPVYHPIDVFLETTGNENGNESVLASKARLFRRRAFQKMETRISRGMETKVPKNGRFRFLSCPCRKLSPTIENYCSAFDALRRLIEMAT